MSEALKFLFAPMIVILLAIFMWGAVWLSLPDEPKFERCEPAR